MSATRTKQYLGVLLAATLAAALSIQGLSASPGSAGITFVEDESHSTTENKPSSSSSGSTSSSSSRDRPGDGGDRPDKDPAPRAVANPQEEDLITLFNPDLPLSALGPLPKTGGGNPPFLSILGFFFSAMGLWLIARNPPGRSRVPPGKPKHC